MIRKGKNPLEASKSRVFEPLGWVSDGAGVKRVEEEGGAVVLLSVTWKNPRSMILNKTCQEKDCTRSSMRGS